MREILFRGKYNDNWVYGSLIDIHTQYVNRTEIHGDVQGYDQISVYKVSSYTVGQYTGLTDKNGNKIFEGDIIQTERYGDIENLIVKYDVELASFYAVDYKEHNYYFTDNYFLSKNCKIIGNICDNPEMLDDAFEPVLHHATPENFELMNG